MAAPEPPELEDVYDEDILARIDRVLVPPAAAGEAAEPAAGGSGEGGAGQATAPTGRVVGVRRLGIGGAMLAGTMAGIGEVFEPERAREHIVEFAPDRLDEDEQLVTFHLVPGAPRASRIIVRPWLLEAWRARR